MSNNICLSKDVSLFEHSDWHLTSDNHEHENEMLMNFRSTFFPKASNATELIKHDILGDPLWWIILFLFLKKV